jgi:hypothetical protein
LTLKAHAAAFTTQEKPMSQSTTLVPDVTLPAASRGGVGLSRVLIGAAGVAAAAGLLATQLLDGVTAATAAPQLAPVASALAVGAGSRDPSVPDAGIVFAGREHVPDDAAPTF